MVRSFPQTRRTTTTLATPTFRLLLRLASPLAQARLSRPLRDARCAEGRGIGCDTVPPRRQREGRVVLPRWHEQAMHRLAEQRIRFPVTIYYAFKQSEGEGDAGTASTGGRPFWMLSSTLDLQPLALGRCELSEPGGMQDFD